MINVTYPPDNFGIYEDFDIIGTVGVGDLFRYSVMCALGIRGRLCLERCNR